MTKEEIEKLTPEEKRRKIAEKCGYISPFTTSEEQWSDEGGGGYAMVTRDSRFNPLPDYLSDLNAMAEAEGVILGPNSPLVWVNYEERGEIKRAYQDNLERVATLGGTSAICATAAQRAEAFLLTIC